MGTLRIYPIAIVIGEQVSKAAPEYVLREGR